MKYMKQASEFKAIKFIFNPPSAPHFEGLWKSGLKSVKTHIAHVVGHQVLILEEFNMLIVQIKAILNSRPLCSLSSDPNNLTVLTPCYFLTLEPLMAVADPDLTNLKISRLSPWQLVQQLQQSFWKRRILA